jgi:hypothetical protein
MNEWNKYQHRDHHADDDRSNGVIPPDHLKPEEEVNASLEQVVREFVETRNDKEECYREAQKYDGANVALDDPVNEEEEAQWDQEEIHDYINLFV